jgi:hypothetical protein
MKNDKPSITDYTPRPAVFEEDIPPEELPAAPIEDHEFPVPAAEDNVVDQTTENEEELDEEELDNRPIAIWRSVYNKRPPMNGGEPGSSPLIPLVAVMKLNWRRHMCQSSQNQDHLQRQ